MPTTDNKKPSYESGLIPKSRSICKEIQASYKDQHLLVDH